MLQSHAVQKITESVNLILIGLRLLVNEISPEAPTPPHLIWSNATLITTT